jgi:hypothetical protein
MGIPAEEYRARRRAGIEVDLLTARDLADRFSFRRPAALLSHLAGEIDALGEFECRVGWGYAASGPGPPAE